jgi:asparagine synthase (glutamine-hydrolysing)
MCGIAGRVNYASGAPVDPAVISRMCDLLAHRGPDGDGVWCEGPVGLGHRRLAVIDLSPLGRQPMATDDGALTVTFNGEVYNFLELRAELEGLGHRFRSHSDTEVILAAYRQWGPDCVRRLAGMFAFVLWDAPRRRVFAARDRLGKKPFFYRLDRDGVAFASEPKAFLAEESFIPEVDLSAVSQYLSYQYVPAPRSGFKGVQKLPPAHTLLIEDGRLSLARYWKLSYGRKVTLTEREAVEALGERLRCAVKRRLISDVPLGAFLSGGIDSGLVVSFMAECLDTPVRTFSIGFQEEAYNELPAARMVAERYGTEHREFVVRPHAIDFLPQLVWHYGEPYADSSALPTYILSELTRRHVTVALTGDAGDESFGGYDRYVASVLAQRLEGTPLAARRVAAALIGLAARMVRHPRVQRAHRFSRALAEPRASRRYASWVMHFTPEAKARLCTPEFQAAAPDDSYARLDQIIGSSDGTDLVERLLDADVHTYLPDDLLVKVDIATMAHALEGRSPFLDHELMEFAATLPVRFKVQGGEKKVLLRRLAASRLPARLLTMPKKGFGVPIDHWFRGELRDFAREALLDGRLARRGYFDMRAVEQLFQEHASGRAAWHLQLWNLLMLELWHRMFIDARPSGPPPRVAVAAEEARVRG